MASYQEEQKHSEISSSIPDQVVETSLNDPSLVITQHSASPDKTTATNDEQNEIMPEQQLCSNLDDKVVNAVTVVDIDKKELEDNSSSEPTSDTSGKKEQQELKQSIQQDQNTSDASASNNHQQHEEIEQNDKYYVKWIEFNTELVPILLQNANGPCPLLAIMNVLLLRQKICINADICILSAEQILAYLVDFLFQCVPKNIPDEEHLNYEQNINDAMAVLDKLKTGLDVNVKFDRYV
ncbi:unnamed protein product [Didymodactylos carnosus]|uniref:Ubiquitin carboxyl-terminal hydrolase n=1 Tax=Didymodactylos carnosus TaxID=1234261 RepID=A0A8S2PCK6_9BILA|nr:unnamed protein product [Didymodactylos carnosus]CAF4047998.1 unnamed protein product [Didymodactylos carnosus]